MQNGKHACIEENWIGYIVYPSFYRNDFALWASGNAFVELCGARGVTGWSSITYMQALALLLLCKILFGSFGGGGRGGKFGGG